MALDTIESDKYTPLRKMIDQLGIVNFTFILTSVASCQII
jgi:hypothetical protein